MESGELGHAVTSMSMLSFHDAGSCIFADVIMLEVMLDVAMLNCGISVGRKKKEMETQER